MRRRCDRSSLNALRALLAELLTGPAESRPSALFLAHSQYAAVAVEEATLRHGFQIPKDLSILGCGTAPESLISSVCIPAETIGTDGMVALLDVIAGNARAAGAMYEPVLTPGVTLARRPG